MLKRITSGTMLTLLLLSMLTLTLHIQVGEASGTIYIRGDGSIDPPTAPISTVDNVTYTFTDNINDFLVIERSNIIVDGAGYTLWGNGSGRGIDFLSFGYLYNITIRNMEIRDFEYGIYAEWCVGLNISRNRIQTNSELHGIWLHWSFNNVLVENNITASALAVYLDSCLNNTLMKNKITWNYAGICLISSSSNHIVGNNITNNQLRGVWLDSSSNNTLAGNNMTSNGVGIEIENSSNNNTLTGNNITLNSLGTSLASSSNNTLTGNNVRENNQYGIRLLSSSNNNTLAGNNISSGNYGISLSASSNNTLAGNNITANVDFGIRLTDSSNNTTLAGNDVVDSGRGIYLSGSSNNSISGNNVTANSLLGIKLSASSNNSISRNSIANNGADGIDLTEYSNYNSIVGNNLTSNGWAGIFLENSANNTFAENNVTGNAYCGIGLDKASDNRIYHNNFADNLIIQVVVLDSLSVWDDGYSSGGNYWSDYTGVDFYHGPYQNLTGCDGVGDTPYTINENNTDHYPLMKPYPETPDVAVINITLSKTVVGFGYLVLINVTVENQNCFTETFNLTLCAQWEPPPFPIATITVSNLSSGETRTITFTCNTTTIGKGNYTIIAVADTVPREIDTLDNTYPDGWILVTKVGDFGGGIPPQFFKCDDKVDGLDLALFIACYKKLAPPEAMYLGDLGGGIPPRFYQCDGKVDGIDLALFIACYKGLGPDP